MQEKVEAQNPFNSLPKELTKRILEQSLEKPKDLKNMALTCSLFQKLTLLERLAHAVTAGHQNSAEAILKKYPHLLTQRLEFKDMSKRLFKATSVWEYVLWAWDVRYMGPMMLQCLPHNKQGEAIRIELDKQFDELEKNGLAFELNGVLYTQKHYDFAIITALRDYADNWVNRDWVARNKAWCTGVGGAQLLVPAHVAQHYCDPEESFHPSPAFTKKKFIRSLKFLNRITGQKESWFSAGTRNLALGINFAILRLNLKNARAWGSDLTLVPELAWMDLTAMITLYKVRTEDLALLKKRLQNPLQQPHEEPDLEGFILS